MMRLFIDEFNAELEAQTKKNNYLELKKSIKRIITVATGKLTYPTLCQFANKIMEKYPEIKIHVYAIRNDFFGETITVSGLITGQDLVKQINEHREVEELGPVLYIPSNMLRMGEEVFLDDMTLHDVEKAVQMKVIPIDSGGADFVHAIVDETYAMEERNENFVYIQAYKKK